MPDSPHFAVPFTFRTPKSTAKVTEQGRGDNISDQIKVLLAFPIGSRIDQPQFGRPDILFRQSDSNVAEQLSDAITNWIPEASTSVTEVRQQVDSFIRLFRIVALVSHDPIYSAPNRFAQQQQPNVAGGPSTIVGHGNVSTTAITGSGHASSITSRAQNATVANKQGARASQVVGVGRTSTSTGSGPGPSIRGQGITVDQLSNSFGVRYNDAAIDSIASTPFLVIYEENEIDYVGASDISIAQFGFAPGNNFHTLTTPQLTAAINAIGAAGGKWVKINIDWSVVQAGGSGTFVWTAFDAVINAANAASLNIVGTIAYTPTFARPAGGTATSPPVSNADYATFCTAAVNRYKVKIKTWEVWTEPNVATNWTAPSPANYEALLAAAYPAIKTEDSTATVLTGGLAPSATSAGNYDPRDFLTGLYTAGGKNFFDAVGNHPYNYPNDANGTESNNSWYQMFGAVTSLRSIMTVNGDSAKKIWITEYGAPTNGLTGESFGTEADQAADLAAAATQWKSYSWAGNFMWYSLQDLAASGSNVNFFGLLRSNGTAKPAYASFQQLMGNITPPIDLTAPTISGNTTVGSVLTVDRGTWSGATSYTQRWTRKYPIDAVSTRNALYTFASNQLIRTDTLLNPNAYPQLTNGTIGWTTQGLTFWTSGFYAGLCWQMYIRTNDATWRTRAETWQANLSAETGLDVHDLGMMFEWNFARGYELTGTTTWRDFCRTAATTLSNRYNAAVGAFRSWNTDLEPNFNTIIDSAMNAGLMFWAARNGSTDAATLYSRAKTHMNTLRTQHVRGDGGTYHVVTYNSSTGAVILKRTEQGFSDSSTWARGQAWGMYGFIRAYNETIVADPSDAANFLATAIQMAGYFLDNLPADGLPWWDFQAPLAQQVKDSSAAAIAATALVEIGKRDVSRNWRGAAKKIMGQLSGATYQSTATGPYSVLLHGVSNYPGNSGRDNGLIYGDHFWLHALNNVADTPAVGDAIDSATNTTYTITSADAGATLSCVVTAINSSGSTELISSNTIIPS